MHRVVALCLVLGACSVTSPLRGEYSGKFTQTVTCDGTPVQSIDVPVVLSVGEDEAGLFINLPPFGKLVDEQMGKRCGSVVMVGDGVTFLIEEKACEEDDFGMNQKALVTWERGSVIHILGTTALQIDIKGRVVGNTTRRGAYDCTLRQEGIVDATSR